MPRTFRANAPLAAGGSVGDIAGLSPADPLNMG
jgi:hypothetical protein